MVTGCRYLSFLETTSSDPAPTRNIDSLISDQKLVVDRLETSFNSTKTEDASLPAGLELDGEDIMNSSKEAELLAMQHILGLKDASDESIKIKPTELERLQRLKAAEPVFVCIDLEAYEFAQEKITEVGVSVLDSRHVVGIDPGPDGSKWLSKITTRHLITREYKHLVNKRFVHGCPDKFNFGKSEIVFLNRIHTTLTQLFANPSPGSVLATDKGPRKLILVGHGLSNDTAYLSKLKFDPHAKGNIIQDVDTQRFVGTKKQTVGLSRLMTGLGVSPENLHNAGNDAAYTLQALVLMTVQHTNNPGAYVKAVAEAKAKVDPAKQRYKDHKAKLREQRLAQEKTKPTKVANSRSGPGEHTVESLFASPLLLHDRHLAQVEDNKASNLTEPSQEPEAIVPSWETFREGSSHYIPVSDTIPELEGRIRYGGLTGDEIAAQEKYAIEALQARGDVGRPWRRHALANRPEHVAHDRTSAIDEVIVESPSRKRKSFDVEPIKDAWEDDDDFSISPSFYPEPRRSQIQDTDDNDGGVSVIDSQTRGNSTNETMDLPITTQDTAPEGSSFRITKHVWQQGNTETQAQVDEWTARCQRRDRVIKEQAEQSLRTQPTDVNGQPSSLTPTAEPSDQPVVRRVNMGGPILRGRDAAMEQFAAEKIRENIGDESSSFQAAPQEQDQSIVRREPLGRKAIMQLYASRTNIGDEVSSSHAAPQEPNQSTVRWTPLEQDEAAVKERRERSNDSVARKPYRAHPPEPKYDEPETEEPPPRRSEDIKGFLRNWLDNE
ncbi:hypothetical protein E4T50_06097 [Aureobasidium sp. EXF-12298]|nr:hypothetical protein E4T50_06097 [Aureobasidium sp. EXF-12298]